jgi:hypothetical protein
MHNATKSPRHRHLRPVSLFQAGLAPSRSRPRTDVDAFAAIAQAEHAGSPRSLA